MAYEIPEKWSVGLMRDYVVECSSTIESFAALPMEALEKLPPDEREEEKRRIENWRALVPVWAQMERTLEAELENMARQERQARIKRGRVRAADVRWDGAVARLGAEVQLASGNNPKLPPYSTLFGSTTVARAQSFGPKRAGLHGRALAKKALTLDDAFASAALRVDVFSELLERMGDERDELAVVQAEAQARKVKLHESLEELVAATERRITGFLPRVEAKVVIRDLLAPQSSKPRKSAQESETDDANAGDAED